MCDKDADGTAITNIVTKTGATFETFCALLESGPWTLSTGEVLDLIDFIGEGVNEHTIFAPTDAAFAEIQSLVDAALDLETTNPSAFDNIVPYWLQLHILPDTYLASDFTCDDTYDTLNLSGRATGSQKQKTKCRGQASTFTQIGGGNVGSTDQPTVGQPADIFPTAYFDNANSNVFTTTTTSDGTSISSNVIACNGVIHVVDSVLLPSEISTYCGYYGYYGAKGAYYGTKGTKGYGKGKAGKGDKAAGNRQFFGRLLEENKPADTDPEADRENRRARLEALLVDANGNIEPLN